MRLSTRILGTAFAVLHAPWAHACTVCNSPNGHRLRAGLFDGHFLHTLLLVAAPAPLLLAAVLLLHHALPDLPDGQPRHPGKDTRFPVPPAPEPTA